MGDNETLIEAVRGFDCLWKLKLKAYKDLRAKENTWKAMSEKVEDSTPADCQRHWKNLRDKYVCELKKVKKGKSGDEGPPVASNWPLFEVMSFIDDNVHHCPTTTNYNRPSSSLGQSESSDIRPEEPENGYDAEDEDLSLETYADSPSEPGTSRETSSVETSSRETSVARQQASKKNMKQTKKRSHSGVDDLEVAILSKLCVEEECDAEEHFGFHVASTLRSLPLRQRACTKIEIDGLLFSAQFPEMHAHHSHHPTTSHRLYPPDSYLPSTPAAPPVANFQSHTSPDPEIPFNY